MAKTMAEFVSSLSYEDLPADLMTVLRRSFADTMGVAAIGSTSSLSSITNKSAGILFGATKESTSRGLMGNEIFSAAGAAMAGAFMIDSVDAHDGTTPNKGHAGSAVFPALLAVGDALRTQGQSITGRAFAVWLAAAYETSYRAGQVQHATCPDYHTSGAWTAVGVAAVTAKMLGCSVEQIRHAAGIGEYHGPRSQMMRCIDYPTMVRDGVGWGAPSGVVAGYLAKEGFTGAPALTCEGEGAEPYWRDLGQSWLAVKHTHYKAYPCCRWAHPSIDAVKDLVAKHKLNHEQISSVEIRTFHYATRLAGYEPKTPDEFAYSIAFPVAAMLVRGKLGAGELAPETLNDPDILRISRATKLIDDPELTARSVQQRWAAVTLKTKEGGVYSAEPRTARGDRDNPLSDQDIKDKYDMFTDGILEKCKAEELFDLASNFDSLGEREFSKLMDLCLGGALLA